jgi:hypothetical protein
MHNFSYFREGLVFILMFSTLMAVPCVGTAILGSSLIQNLGQFPSKSAKFQMRSAMPLLSVMIVSYGLFILFFYYFCD